MSIIENRAKRLAEDEDVTLGLRSLLDRAVLLNNRHEVYAVNRVLDFIRELETEAQESTRDTSPIDFATTLSDFIENSISSASSEADNTNNDLVGLIKDQLSNDVEEDDYNDYDDDEDDYSPVDSLISLLSRQLNEQDDEEDREGSQVDAYRGVLRVSDVAESNSESNPLQEAILNKLNRDLTAEPDSLANVISQQLNREVDTECVDETSSLSNLIKESLIKDESSDDVPVTEFDSLSDYIKRAVSNDESADDIALALSRIIFD